MDWKGERRSNNIDDQRNAPLAAGIGGAAILFRFLPYLIGTKIGRTILVIGGVVYFGARLLGVDILQVMSGAPANTAQPAMSAQEQELTDFVSVILASTEDSWKTEFQKMGRTYQEPTLSLFRGRVDSACGLASAATGPFYCPADGKLYIDLSFYEKMKTKLGAPGDFAQAYVIAHEVGHHVQNLLGISAKVSSAQRASSTTQANALSVRLELQADCFAGIWGHYADNQRKLLDSGDINEALNAAAAIGDDRLQEKATGAVRPEKFTHGTSKQRAEWFNRGFQTGAIESCNTFKN
ncbi:neutral zinc metallopeptidase [Cellvibrio sp.]|uniref:KPN_02809 family neutral zinc metallopeptidase n=1 Tax=Cellvibrio sp. TaxID=1965322 RepID=UPI0039648845